MLEFPLLYHREAASFVSQRIMSSVSRTLEVGFSIGCQLSLNVQKEGNILIKFFCSVEYFENIKYND